MDNQHLGYSPKQLSKLIPFSVQTLARDRKNGHIGLPFIKKGRKIVYPALAVHEWLKGESLTPSVLQTNETNLNNTQVKRTRGRPAGSTKKAMALRRERLNRSHKENKLDLINA